LDQPSARPPKPSAVESATSQKNLVGRKPIWIFEQIGLDSADTVATLKID
jgi:hypothetical protein